MSDINRLTELAERLRDKAFKRCGPTMEAVHTKTDEWKAADAIDELMAALKPFADAAEHFMPDNNSDIFAAASGHKLYYSDLRAARAAYLGEKE